MNQPQTTQTTQSKQPSGTTIIIGIVVVLVVLFIASRLFSGGGGTDNPSVSAPVDDSQPVQDNSDPNLNLGSVVVAENVDRDGCAVDVTDSFDDNDTIYAVLTDSAVPQGTTVFARLYHDGVALEDSDESTAADDYTNVCVNFAFDNSAGWDEGEYEVEFWVNGNAYQSASFTVR
jgi:hypothetical protein